MGSEPLWSPGGSSGHAHMECFLNFSSVPLVDAKNSSYPGFMFQTCCFGGLLVGATLLKYSGWSSQRYKGGQGICVRCDAETGRASPVRGLSWAVTAECSSDSNPVSLLPQDWQEIVALYEKDNSYLGGVAPSGHPGVQDAAGGAHPHSSKTLLGFWEAQTGGKRLGCRCLQGGNIDSTECWEGEEGQQVAGNCQA